MPQVIFSKAAEKEFTRLPLKEKKKIIRKVKALRDNPRLGKLLVGELKDLWSCRAWPYRIIYQFQASKRRIVIYQIIHRQKTYR